MTTPKNILALSLLALTSGLLFVSRVGDRRPHVPDVVGRPDPVSVVLAASSAPDSEISKWQHRVRIAPETTALERLGFAFLDESVRTSDAGFVNLAEQCAIAMLEREEDDVAALFLLGRVRHDQHRFADAEHEARLVTARRGRSFDFGLLGDVLLDRGDLDGAAAAYQRMVDLRPDARSFARAAEVRFRKGDLDGARRAIERASTAATPRDDVGFAWIWSRRAELALHAAAFDEAQVCVDTALRVAPESAVAELVLGRLELARDRFERAIPPLRRAAERAGTPTALHLLADALGAAGRVEERAEVERRLVATGERSDPRGLALFLAVRGVAARRALRLAEDELRQRRDAESIEVLGWARLALDDAAGALDAAREARAAGRVDPRLFLLGGLALERLRDPDATNWLERARRGRHLLPPLLRRRLDTVRGVAADDNV